MLTCHEGADWHFFKYVCFKAALECQCNNLKNWHEYQIVVCLGKAVISLAVVSMNMKLLSALQKLSSIYSITHSVAHFFSPCVKWLKSHHNFKATRSMKVDVSLAVVVLV